MEGSDKPAIAFAAAAMSSTYMLLPERILQRAGQLQEVLPQAPRLQAERSAPADGATMRRPDQRPYSALAIVAFVCLVVLMVWMLAGYNGPANELPNTAVQTGR
jgi:ferric-dicitrate binding protein FerR (iron transport regulator)